jgi:hypothetical protein
MAAQRVKKEEAYSSRIKKKEKEGNPSQEKAMSKEELIQELLPTGLLGKGNPTRFSKVELEELYRQNQGPTPGIGRVIPPRSDPLSGLSSYSKSDLVEVSTFLGHQNASTFTAVQLMLWVRQRVEAISHVKIGIGMFKQKSILDIIAEHPSYVTWAEGLIPKDRHPQLSALCGISRMVHRYWPSPKDSKKKYVGQPTEATPPPWVADDQYDDGYQSPEEEDQRPIPPTRSQRGTSSAGKPPSYHIGTDESEMDQAPPAWQEKKTRSTSTSEGEYVQVTGGVIRAGRGTKRP